MTQSMLEAALKAIALSLCIAALSVMDGLPDAQAQDAGQSEAEADDAQKKVKKAHVKRKPGNRKPYVYCYYEKGKYDGDGESSDLEDNPPAEPNEAISKRKSARQLRKGQPTRWVHDGRWKLLNSGNLFDLKNDPDEKSPIPNGEAGPEGEAKRVVFQRVLDEKSTIRKEYGPAAVGTTRVPANAATR